MFVFVFLCTKRIASDEESSESQIDLEYQEGLLKGDISVFDDKAVICKTTSCHR